MVHSKTLLICTVGVFLFSSTSLFAVEEWKLQGQLFQFIIRDKDKEVAKILEEHPDFAKKIIEYHTYPVFEAARAGAIKCLKLLVEKGADPNVRDKTGSTIFHYMFTIGTINKREAMLDYLINEKKVKLDTMNKQKLTPFHSLFGSYRCKIKEKNAEVLIPLFKKYKVNLDVKDAGGMGVLHYLSKISKVKKPPTKTNMSNMKVAMILLKYGADPNISNKLKQTPLIIFLASVKKLPEDMQEEYVNCLLDYGAKPKAKSKKRETPLKLVKKKGKIYKILKKKRKKKQPLSVK